MAPRLSCPKGGAKPPATDRGAAILRRRALCHLGGGPRGCLTWVALRAAAPAAMLTKWAPWEGPNGRHSPTHQGNHAPLEDAFSHRRPGRGDAVCRQPDICSEFGPKARG